MSATIRGRILSDGSAACAGADGLYGRSDYAEYPAGGVDKGQVALLYAAQSLCRGCVAGKDYEVAALLEKFLHSLKCELVDQAERACAIRSAGVISQI